MSRPPLWKIPRLTLLLKKKKQPVLKIPVPKMLTLRAREALATMMAIGAFLKVIPYQWDSEKCRLSRDISRIHKILFRLHTLLVYFIFFWVTFRFFQKFNDDTLPLMLRIMNIIWLVAYGLVCAGNLQYELKREEILFFANSLFEALELEEIRKKDPKTSAKEPYSNWPSRLLLVSSFLLYVNPGAHAAVLVKCPCVPHYVSSVLLPCASSIDVPVGIIGALPFVAFEHLVVGDAIYLWSFNWCMIFLGLVWIRNVMTNGDLSEHKYLDGPGLCKRAPRCYRLAQLLTKLINEAFVYFLAWFPLVFFTMSGLLIFSCIRYTSLDFSTYVVFPFCLMRCLFETLTMLGIAGNVNQESVAYLAAWGRSLSCIEDKHEQKINLALFSSCYRLKCSSGSMYSFRNTIVLLSWDRLTQFTFNMLVTYP